MAICFLCDAEPMKPKSLAKYRRKHMDAGYFDIRRCLFCDLFLSARGLNTHMRGHFKKEEGTTIDCPCCIAPEGEKSLTFDDFAA